MLHDLGKGTVREGDHRRAAGQGFHGDQRAGLGHQAGHQQAAGAASSRRLRAKPTGPMKRRGVEPRRDLMAEVPLVLR